MKPINKIKVTSNTLEIKAVITLIESLGEVYLPIRETKFSRSILFEAYQRLVRKLVTKSAAKKSFDVSLPFYEAHILEQFLRTCIEFDDDVFILCLANKLHQKLA